MSVKLPGRYMLQNRQEFACESIDISELAREIAPCFVERAGRRTDQVVLACTHFPLLSDLFAEVAPWPVAFVDPAPAIARRVDALLPPAPRDAAPARLAPAIFTSGRAPSRELETALRRFGLPAAAAAPDRLRA